METRAPTMRGTFGRMRKVNRFSAERIVCESSSTATVNLLQAGTVRGLVALSSECGTYKTVKARFSSPWKA